MPPKCNAAQLADARAKRSALAVARRNVAAVVEPKRWLTLPTAVADQAGRDGPVFGSAIVGALGAALEHVRQAGATAAKISQYATSF